MTVIKPNVYIPFTVSQILEWLREDHKKMEWSVLGRVIKHNDMFIVTDVFVPKQKNSSGYTEMEDPLSELQDYLIETGKYENAREWRLRFHSHHTMQPFRSGTDNATRKSLCTDVFFDEEMNHWWSLSIVIGAWPSYHATVDYAYKENEQMIMTHQDVEVVIWLYDDVELPEEEINTYKEALVFKDNTEIVDLFPTDIADRLFMNANLDIETKKEKLTQQRINAKAFDRAVSYEQSLLDNGVMIELPTLEEYIEVLKEKEKQPVPVYKLPQVNWLFWNINQYNKKKHNKKWKNKKYDYSNTYEDYVSPQMMEEYGIKYSHQKQWYINPKTNLVVNWKEAVEVYKTIKEIEDNKSLFYNEDLTAQDLEDFGYVYRPMQKDWVFETAPWILSIFTFAEAKDDCIKNNEEFFDIEEVIEEDKFVTAVELEDSWYSRDETTKARFVVEDWMYVEIWDFKTAQQHYRETH